MKSWKTTLCGSIAIIGSTVPQFFPEYPMAVKVGGCAAAIATGIGLLFARDNNVNSEQAGVSESDRMLQAFIKSKPEEPKQP